MDYFGPPAALGKHLATARRNRFLAVVRATPPAEGLPGHLPAGRASRIDPSAGTEPDFVG
jgi:hypothetical protein